MVLIAGSANLDFVIRADRIPTPGETVMGNGFATYPGGKGANQAVACARAGGVLTAMLVALGNDSYAQPLIDSLTLAGVQLHTVRVDEAPTGSAFICVANDGENAITVAPGANLYLQASHLPPLGGVSHLLMQLEIPMPAALAYAQAAKAQGVQVVLNAAPAQAIPEQLLALVDILIVNQGELATLLANPHFANRSVQDQLVQLQEQTQIDCVVVTLGAAGSLARSGGIWIEQAAYPVQVVDTTAAGDTFCGTLVAALSTQQPLAKALQTASAAAALACTQAGAQTSIPTQAAVSRYLDACQNRKELNPT